MKQITSVVLLLCIVCSLFVPCLATASAAQMQSVELSGIETKATASWDNDGDGTLSILCIGNSFSVDMMQYFYNIAKNLGISSIYLGNLYIGGCTLNKHYTNAKNDSAAYTYYTNNSGTWNTTKDYKMSKAVSSRSWDFVSMQQASGDSGTASTYNSDLTNLISYVKGKLKSSSTKLVWHMTWAYEGGSSKLANSVYSSQTDMYDKIISAVKSKIASNSNFKMIIPSGTAIQNARTSLLKDNMCRDGYHLDYYVGRYIAGLTAVKKLTGLDISKVTYRPTNVGYALQQIAIESANNAVTTPYAKTSSAHGNVTSSKLYARLYPNLTAGGYWNSANSNYNKIIKTADNSSYFHCTERFDKTTLPVGSVIKVSSGYEYRPDGWVSDAKQDSATRPDITSKSYTVAMHKWWTDKASWTMRGFNICSTTDKKDISKMTADQIHEIFQIYVPIDDLSTKYYQLRLEITPLAYWHSSNASNYNKLITSSDINQRFFATQQIPKANIPNGSVIKVSKGWQHRPEGWVSNAVQDASKRPAVRTDRSILVNSTWHSNFTTRAFNISKQDESSLEGVELSTMQAAFKIYIPAASHTHSLTTTVTKAATCTDTGTKTSSCTVCVYSKTETIPVTGHTSVEVAATAPTCTSMGMNAGTRCSVCNLVLSGCETIPELGHTYETVVTAPTCTTAGYTTYTCSVCKDSYIGDETEVTGHSYDNGVITTDPTCTTEGVMTFTCTCGDSYTESIAASGHTEAIDEAVAPTCVATGLTEGKHCSVCNAVLLAQEDIAALGHDYATVVTEPTCTTGGFTTYTCTACKDTYIDDEIIANGHSYDEGKVTTEPSCTEEGVMTFTCSCGDSYTESIEKIKHETIFYPAKDASCTEEGYTSHYRCSSCDNIYVDEECQYIALWQFLVIPAVGHSVTFVPEKAATCTEDGYNSHYQCSLCEQCYADENCAYLVPWQNLIISSTGHAYHETVTAPTCTKPGQTTYTCTACGDSYLGNTVDALGHSYVSEVTAPTCTNVGFTTYTCVACDDTYTADEVEALGHAYEATITVPTCVDAGFTTYICAVCGDTYTADEIEATGHSYTYTDNGENHTVGCANCTYSELADHTFVDGSCICGAVEKTEPEMEYVSTLESTMSIGVGAEMQVFYTVLNSRVKNYASFYVEVVKDVAGGEPVTTIFSIENGNLEAFTNNSGAITRYMATYTGIAAKEMGDSFTATLYAVDATGKVYYGPSETSSIKEYLTSQIENADSAELKTLAVDMLHYGAAAQINFAYDAENLVNADLTEEQLALGTQIAPSASNGFNQSASGCRVNTSVSIGSKVELYLTFIYKPTAESKMELRIKNAKGDIIGTLTPAYTVGANYRAVYDNVGAKQMRELITIELYDNGMLVSKSTTWSIETYVAQTIENSASSVELVNVCKAMLTYGDAAAAYLAASGQ